MIGRAQGKGVGVSEEPDVLSEPSVVAARPQARELGGRLAGLSLPRQVLTLAIWPFGEQCLGFLVGFVDTALAGRISVEATNAIGVSSYIGWLIGLAQSSIAIGASVLIARSVGARHKRIANAAVGQSAILALMMGLLVGLLIYSLAGWIAAFSRLQGDSYLQCVTYLRILSLATPMSGLLFVGAACLRGAGDTRSPFEVLVIVNLVNAAVSLMLVKAPAPLGGHGVAGIAWGTVCAWTVGAVLIQWVLIRGKGGIRLRWIRLRPHLHTMQRILNIGLPNLIESFLGMWIVQFLIIRIVGLLGDPGAWGAHIIAIRIEAISYLPGYAIAIAASTLAGQYLGADNPEKARAAVRLCWVWGAAVMGFLGLIFVLVPGFLVRMVTDQPSFLESAPPLLRMCGMVQMYFGSAIILGQGMRGAGDTRTTMIMTACCTYGVRLPLAYLMGITLGLGLVGVWIGLCAELVVRGLAFSARFLHGGWLKVKV